MPPSGRKLRKLFFTNWQPTKVTLGGVFTRHRRTGGKFVICRQVSIIGFFTGSVVFTTRKNVAVFLWLFSAALLLGSTFLFQPIINASTCTWIVVCRSIIMATFTVSVIHRGVELAAGEALGEEGLEIISVIVWVALVTVSMAMAYYTSTRYPWDDGTSRGTRAKSHPSAQSMSSQGRLAITSLLSPPSTQVAPFVAGTDPQGHRVAQVADRVRILTRLPRKSSAVLPSSVAAPLPAAREGGAGGSRALWMTPVGRRINRQSALEQASSKSLGSTPSPARRAKSGPGNAAQNALFAARLG